MRGSACKGISNLLDVFAGSCDGATGVDMGANYTIGFIAGSGSHCCVTVLLFPVVDDKLLQVEW